MTTDLGLKNFLWKSISIVILAIGIAGCRARNIEPAYGTYVADYGAATETLTLARDGRFVQQVTTRPDNHTVTSKGHWSFDQPTGFVILDSGYIETFDALGRLRPGYETPLTGVVDMPVVSCLGREYIGSGEFVLYAKKNPQRLPYAARFCGKIL
ncbi:MAG: hypothetical protein IVW54_17745 [Candidatus Binataceae bacterium]|nr:hypothetical protein [Candidatus Binataceae bacterium]